MSGEFTNPVPDSANRPEVADFTPISDINPIEESRQMRIINSTDIDKYVEEPLRKAALEFFRKNIKTFESSANKKNINDGYVYIKLEYNSLTDENQLIAEGLISRGDQGPFVAKIYYDSDTPILSLHIIVPKDVTTGGVEKKSLELASLFEYQAPKTYTLEQLDEYSGYKKMDIKTTKEDYISMGYYYDEESNVFYESEEIFKMNQGR